ncbi:hypothetical protein [Streptomyces sp. OfavH-34-F]|uniref:hypothetical protein n=1 Tax=Streptomyces sp. OfavH-34-F TaxID=2917760 RepID=UPI001EF37444|nr:hypothetical protein [Streptomyces sp. OfavH-34-F]
MVSPSSATAVVHVKATRSALYDFTLTIALPEEVGAQPAAIRQYVEELRPEVLAAECTDSTLDRTTDVVLVDVLGIEFPAKNAIGGAHDER